MQGERERRRRRPVHGEWAGEGLRMVEGAAGGAGSRSGPAAGAYKASGAYTALRGGGGIPVRPGAALGAPEGLGVPPVPCQRCPPRPAPAVSVSVKPRWAGASSRRELLGRGCRHPGRAGGARPQRGRRSRGCKVRLSSAAAALSWSSFRELAAVPCDISKAT